MYSLRRKAVSTAASCRSYELSARPPEAGVAPAPGLDGTICAGSARTVVAARRAVPVAGSRKAPSNSASGIRDNHPVGPRRPLYRVFPGMAIIPVARAVTPDDQALLAAPLPRTRIGSIPLAELKQLGAFGEDYALVASLVASWIGVITHGLPPPKDYQALRGGEPLSLQKGQALCAVDRLLWVKLCGGTAAFMDEEDLRITPSTPALPLRSDVWCRALEDVSVVAVAESAVVASGDFWLGVGLYQQLAVRSMLRACSIDIAGRRPRGCRSRPSKRPR